MVQLNNKQETEIIICAAIWYKDFPFHIHNTVNTGSGLVVSGYRHGQVIGIVNILAQLRTVEIAPDAVGEYVQGFLTNKNRFLDRKEAHKLFVKNGGKPDWKDELYSEDLY